MRQTGQGYLTNGQFIDTYMGRGWSVAKRYAPGITLEQFRIDQQGLYGALQSSTRNSNRGRQYLAEYVQEMDGVKVWYAFLQDFNQGSNIAAKAVDELQGLLDIPFTDKFPGGLVAYLDQTTYAYTQLEVEDPYRGHHAGVGDRQKMHHLRNKLQDSAYSHYVYDRYEYYVQLGDDMRFDNFIKDIKQKYQYIERGMAHNARRRALTSIRDIEEADTSAPDERIANYVNNRRDFGERRLRIHCIWGNRYGHSYGKSLRTLSRNSDKNGRFLPSGIAKRRFPILLMGDRNNRLVEMVQYRSSMRPYLRFGPTWQVKWMP